jgi:poly(3-hydroxybutyrate) depolymerase
MVIVVPLVSCGAAAQRLDSASSTDTPKGATEHFLAAQGHRRDYFEHIPKGVAAGSALVLVLHGGGGNAART